jgi:hypothetical protein
VRFNWRLLPEESLILWEELMSGPVCIDVLPRPAISVRQLVWGDPDYGPIHGMEVFQPLVKLPFLGGHNIRDAKSSP